jgi:hypothetical protein
VTGGRKLARHDFRLPVSRISGSVDPARFMAMMALEQKDAGLSRRFTSAYC